MLGDKLEESDRTEDWRDGVGSQKEVMSYIHTHQLFSNSVLMVGEEKTPIKVIKEIVQSLSIVLQRRLTSSNEWDPQGLPIFQFNDIPLDSMTQLIKFAYTHEWSWSGDVRSLISLLTLNKVADELKVKKLIPKIKTTIDYLMSNEKSFLNPKNVCHIFQEAISVGLENLKNAALKFILRAANLVFSNVENYKMLSESNFIEILKENELEVESELQLFHIALKWGKAKCLELRLNENENLQNVMKDILTWIRFTRMTVVEFLEQVVTTKVLGTYEILEILKKLSLIAAGTSSSMTERENPRKYGPGNSYPSTHKLDEFNQEESIKLIEIVNTSRQDFQIQVDSVPNAVDLMTFLQSTSSTPSRLHLTVDKIPDKNLPPVESPNLTFPQLRSLNFLSLETKTQLECLIRIVTNSPNLHQLSIGLFEWYSQHPYHLWQGSSNVMKFLDSVSLENVEFSCALIGDEGFNVDLLRKLKGNGVSINKLGFSWGTSDQDVGMLEYLSQDLQEIHLLDCTKFLLKFPFVNLKVLSVWCEDQVLLNILRSCPYIQKLKWFAQTSASTSNNEYLYLPHLTSLTLSFWLADGLKFTIENLSNCPNLNELTILTRFEDEWSRVYETFPHIKKLRLVSRKGMLLEILTGVKEESLKRLHWDPSFHPRPPYIGQLKELSSLSFGYSDYQHPNFVSERNLDLWGWTDGICHLPKLTHLQLPPISRTEATSILNVLSSYCRQLELVEFQVWFGQKEGQNGTMTRGQVDQLSISYNKQFKVQGIRVLPYNNDRYCIF